MLKLLSHLREDINKLWKQKGHTLYTTVFESKRFGDATFSCYSILATCKTAIETVRARTRTHTTYSMFTLVALYRSVNCVPLILTFNNSSFSPHSVCLWVLLHFQNKQLLYSWSTGSASSSPVFLLINKQYWNYLFIMTILWLYIPVDKKKVSH